MIEYRPAKDIQDRVYDIALKLRMKHVDLSRVKCVRSVGSKSRYTLARIHVIPKIIQKALDIPAFYIIEVISEKFDKMRREDQDRTLIHELLHIPKGFGGGFRHHRPFVNKRTVEEAYLEFLNS
jgi:predicted metallopeptidase